MTFPELVVLALLALMVGMYAYVYWVFREQHKKSECVKDLYRGSCCCNCKFHVADYRHCVTEPKKTSCVCDDQKGWACTLFLSESGRIFSGWSEHGLCEGWAKTMANETQAGDNRG